MTEEKELKAWVCPEGCVEWQACSACPEGVCTKECRTEQCVAAEEQAPLSPLESFVKAGGKLNYTTVDGEDIPVPYLSDEVEVKVSSPNDILYGDASLKISGMSAEGLHMYLDYLTKVVQETTDMMNERMEFFYGLIKDANLLISNTMKEHTTAKYPDFINTIVLDQVEKKARFKKEMDDKIAAMTPEQRESMQKMMETKTNLS